MAPNLSCAVGVPNVGTFGDPSLLAELAVAAEEHGWDGFFVWDHQLYRDPQWAVADPVVVIAAVAARTARVRLGILVNVLARRRVGKAARESVTLDQLSRGRLVFGAGLGSRAEEFTAFGEPGDAKERAARLDESLELLDALWTGSRSPSAASTHRHRGDHAATPGAAAPDPGLVRRPVAEQGTVPPGRPMGRGHAHPRRRMARPDHAAGRPPRGHPVHAGAPHHRGAVRRRPGGTHRRRRARSRRPGCVPYAEAGRPGGSRRSAGGAAPRKTRWPGSARDRRCCPVPSRDPGTTGRAPPGRADRRTGRPGRGRGRLSWRRSG